MSKKEEQVVISFDLCCPIMELIKRLRAVHANFGDVAVRTGASPHADGDGVELILKAKGLSKEKIKLFKKLGDKPW